MKIDLPEYVSKIIDELRKGGHEAWAVGGAVRDSLLGRAPYDWDVTTSALPDEVRECLEAAGIRVICASGLKHGTVSAICDGASPCEITTYRSESGYSDNRHPDGVSFVSDLATDLSRRDFTVNAMAADAHRIVDPFSGQRDLKERTIRAVGDPMLRFSEDALRILRALRFASQLGFSIETRTLDAMQQLAVLVQTISAERTLAELDKLLSGEHCAGIIKAHGDMLSRAIGVEAKYDGLLAAASHSSLPRDADILFALFFGSNAIEAAGALRLSNKRRLAVVSMLEMKEHGLPLSRADTLRAMRRCKGNIDRCIEYCAGDLSLRQDAETARAILADIRSENACYDIRSLAVNGTDVMSLGFAGAQVGRALEALLEAVIGGEVPNQRDALMAYLEKMRG